MSRVESNNMRYSGEFKQKVVEDMRDNNLSYSEASRKYEIKSRSTINKWKQIYIEDGSSGLYVERRGRASRADGVLKGKPPRFDKKTEEGFIAENQRLRMENDYLKKLNALVQENQLQERRCK